MYNKTSVSCNMEDVVIFATEVNRLECHIQLCYHGMFSIVEEPFRHSIKHAVVPAMFQLEKTARKWSGNMASVGPSRYFQESTGERSGISDEILWLSLVYICSKSSISLETVLSHDFNNVREKDLSATLSAPHLPHNNNTYRHSSLLRTIATVVCDSWCITYILTLSGNKNVVACPHTRIVLVISWFRIFTAA